MSENQVVQLKTTVEEMKRIIEEKDFAYGQSASQIQVLESQIVFLRDEVERFHEILNERPSASSSVKECLTCAKMQESQKKLEKLIDSQKVCKGKAGIGYSPSTEKVKGKAVVKEVNGTKKKKVNRTEKKKMNGNEKKKNSSKKFYGNCLKCNTYGHKASDCKVVKSNVLNVA